MICRRVLGLMLLLAITVGWAAPLAAADKTFDLQIPGCTT